jgi:MraZ protein
VTRRFRGESTHRVDGKGRVSIPAPFRRVLEEGDPDWNPGLAPNLVIVYGQRAKPCLLGYSILGMEKVEAQIDELPYDEDREALELMMLTKSAYAAVDDTGRIVLRHDLRDQIGVTGEALFAGTGERFEVWEPGTYAAHAAPIAAKPVDPLRLLAQARSRAGLSP